jgi:hypothetical protein
MDSVDAISPPAIRPLVDTASRALPRRFQKETVFVAAAVTVVSVTYSELGGTYAPYGRAKRSSSKLQPLWRDPRRVGKILANDPWQELLGSGPFHTVLMKEQKLAFRRFRKKGRHCARAYTASH